MAVARSCTVRCMSAPRAGRLLSTLNRSPAYEPARPMRSPSSDSFVMTSTSSSGASSCDPTPDAGQLVGQDVGPVQQLVDPGVAAAVDDGFEVPRDVPG